MAKRQYNIISYRKLWYFISGTLLIISLAAVALWGLKLGIDFTGGSLVEVEFKDSRPAINDIESVIPEKFGKINVTPLGGAGAALRLRSFNENTHQHLISSF